MMLPIRAAQRQLFLSALITSFVCMLLLSQKASADWQKTDTMLSWQKDGKIVWRFSFDPSKGKPFFDPVSVAGGPAFTNFKPQDHPWHYGMWFSWKYINHVNYWEEDRTTGKAEGATKWKTPVIVTHDDGSATINLDLTYTNPKGQVDMTEARELTISAPAADGSYTIDWTMHFTAGPDGAILDRTPIPNEPKGQVNGGYAGLAVRMASDPLVMHVMSTTRPIAEFQSDRARPNAPAVGCNFTEGDKQLGGLAIFSDPVNAGENAPWYIINGNINNDRFRFVCAAILAPKPITVAAGGKMTLHYRIALSPTPWTEKSLQDGWASWMKNSPANS
jgi:hypothetical protein